MSGGELVLLHARSLVEEQFVRAWAGERYPGAVVVRGDDPQLAGHLGDRSRRVVPARVSWTPVAADRMPSRLRDVVGLTLRAPVPVLQRARLRFAPASAAVVEGDPATCGDLLSAFTESAGPSDRFEEFVARRGVLACERAERRVQGDRYKVPRLMIEEITSTQEFADRATVAAGAAGIDVAAFVLKTRECLAEMVAVQSPLAIDAFRALTSPLHSRAWNVEVDTESLERLRAENRDAALIFLPAHRSYVDPLVMAETLHRLDFPRNHMLGGENLAFWPVGPIGRRAGVIFIRRSFGGDAAYKFAMREYLGHLMAKRFNLEWYIEGGRTRTGKLRQPRYGLLRYLSDAIELVPGVDAVLVPVSIMYDQQSEVGAVVAEQTGATKRKEGAQWFARFIRDQRGHLGSARITFGEPFRLLKALEEAGEGAARLEKVAFRICAGINAVTPVMTTSGVTFALLSTDGRALTIEQIRAVTEPLLAYLDERGIRGPHSALGDPERLVRTLEELESSGVVECYADGAQPVWSIPRDRSHVAAFYRNGAVHHLVVRAIVELGLLQIEKDRPSSQFGGIGTELALALRDLLKFEFFFSDKDQFLREIERELVLLNPGWERREDAVDAARCLLDRCRTMVAPRVVRPIFEAQLVLAEQLTKAADSADRDETVSACLRLGRQRLLQGILRDADSLSRELYEAAWQLAENRQLTCPGPELELRRKEFHAELVDVLELVERASHRESNLVELALGGGGRSDG